MKLVLVTVATKWHLLGSKMCGGTIVHAKHMSISALKGKRTCVEDAFSVVNVIWRSGTTFGEGQTH